jgi:hypothetical protein
MIQFFAHSVKILKHDQINKVILSFLKRERERTAVIFQTFQTVHHVQYEPFRPSKVNNSS